MMKRFAMILLVLVCVLALSACGCKHETWNDADCVTPKTCAECGETEGEALGHTWVDADCVTPKTCSACAVTEGEALGHSWVDADCVTAKTCSTCAVTEGEALGHDWQDATTELPKTCAVCAETEGERIITDPRFTTAATADVQGSWVCDFTMTGEMLGFADMEQEFACHYYLDLGNDGAMEARVEFVDGSSFDNALRDYLVDTLYSELAAEGLNKEQADAAMVEAYGVDVQQYAALIVSSMSAEVLTEAMNMPGVYYVEEGKFFMADDWDMEMEPTEFTLDGDTMTVHEDVIGNGEEEAVFVRVVE